MTFKELLASRNMTGYRFAKLSGIHQPAVSSLVTGRRDPLNMRVYTCKKAADALGMTLEEYYNILDTEEK